MERIPENTVPGSVKVAIDGEERLFTLDGRMGMHYRTLGDSCLFVFTTHLNYSVEEIIRQTVGLSVAPFSTITGPCTRELRGRDCSVMLCLDTSAAISVNHYSVKGQLTITAFDPEKKSVSGHFIAGPFVKLIYDSEREHASEIKQVTGTFTDCPFSAVQGM